MTDRLPTVDDCVRFLEAINAGRRALNLQPLDKLDFDNCEPGDTRNCLSARNLFVRAGEEEGALDEVYVMTNTVRTPEAPKLAPALGAELWGNDEISIPPAIKRVTDPFDHSKWEDSGDLSEQLRDRMLEAGVIE